MTNFERMMKCKTPEEFAYIFSRLKTFALYANGRLLNSSPSDFLEWLNKESNDLDRMIVFDNNIRKCPICGSTDIRLVTISDSGETIEIKEGDSFNWCYYVCHDCRHGGFVNETVIGSSDWPKNQTEALLVWNF